ncbi:galactose mutarotase-like domain-containing protein, partial [Jimgerdemannia flammicorona]
MSNAAKTPRLIPSIVKDRVGNYLSEGANGSDVNLRSILWKHRTSSPDHVKLSVFSVPDLRRISFEEAVKGAFTPTKVGESFGPSWSTHWFRVHLTVPAEFEGQEVQLSWNADNEGLLWTTSGRPLQGLTGGDYDPRHEYTLTNSARAGETFEFYLEMACNGLFGTGEPSSISPPNPNKRFTLAKAELAVPNKIAWQLFYDLQIIHHLSQDLPEDSVRSAQAMYAANKIVNTIQIDDENSLLEALKISKEFLSHKNGTSQHKLTAVGHCHIDTAWLWPYAETKRKIARSWSAQIRLMEQHPDYQFVCSQAQQYEWLELNYPSLFEEVKQKTKEGQFQPIGGVGYNEFEWAAEDLRYYRKHGSKWTATFRLVNRFAVNSCSGTPFDSLFPLHFSTFLYIYVQRYFEKKLGYHSNVFWLPDTFGYSAQLPQIIRESNMKYFFTQKLSWNNINKFPLTTFYWIGLDGSKVLSHMAPSHTLHVQLTPLSSIFRYNARCHTSELIDSAKNHRDKAYSNESLIVYGIGDGGGGPVPQYLERLDRMKDLVSKFTLWAGSRITRFSFLERRTGESRSLLCRITFWNFVQYFEFHRGTYTTASLVKKYNRKNELLLRDLEQLASITSHVNAKGYKYPHEQLERMWKDVCLNQFHDVLPGTSIGLVYDDVPGMHAEVAKLATALRDEALAKLWGIQENASGEKGFLIFNTLPWTRSELIEYELNDSLKSSVTQVSASGKRGYVIADNITGTGSTGISSLASKNLDVTAVAEAGPNDVFILKNKYIQATFGHNGRLVSLLDRVVDRELVPESAQGNVFQMYEDIPLFWDAWDVEIYHLEKGRNLEGGSVKILEQGPLRASLLLETKPSPRSTIRQVISLNALSKRLDFETEVDWNENRQFLKVEFPWNITSDYATYETQYGVIQRPTHYNTTWDAAKFEVCGHKFADLSEYGYGVALLNDCKYGYATHGNVMRLSLLRASKNPDDKMDIGHHLFKYAVYPHANHFIQSDVVREAYAFNVPLLARCGGG